MKHIYFIRHAPTIVNKTGEMVKDYKNVDIIKLSDEEIQTWHDKVGKHIYNNVIDQIYVSNAKRTHETAKILFLKSKDDLKIDEALNEINCSGLGEKKFWEIDENLFNELVHVDLNEFDKNVKEFIDKLLKNEFENVVCITHGLYIRHLYHLLTNNEADTLFKQINSVGFKFNPLDMMELICENEKIRINAYRYRDD